MSALVICFALGLMLIALVHTLGDGIWFWYAQSVLHGERLYADLHLALQPLFVLETAAFQKLLGTGWVISQLPSVIHLCFYAPAFYLLLRPLRWPDWQKAILLLATFVEAVSFVAFRFDDYHVLTDSFVIYSLILLLRLAPEMELKRSIGVSALLGLLSGFAITTRINDGGLLLAATGFALLVIQKRNRIASLLTLTVVASTTVAGVVRLTGDTFHDYLLNSLLHAAAAKGGAGSVLRYPLRLPFEAVHLMAQNWRAIVMGCVVACACAITAWLVQNGRNQHGVWNRKRVALASAGYLVLLAVGRIHFVTQSPQIAVSCVLVYVLIAATITAAVRLLLAMLGRTPRYWTSSEILFLIPLGQLASGSMSSAGSFLGLYVPLAICLALVPLVWPRLLEKQTRRAAFLMMCGLLIVSGLASKLKEPFHWHTYQAGSLASPRAWYQHPVYGPMWLEKDKLGYMTQVCSLVQKDGGPDNSLLTLPYPYFNYFCGIAPWHGVVQTYYDTTGVGVIDKLMVELNSAPPRWIMYQRQLKVVETHERIFNHGAPLPHRALDAEIMKHLESGQWKIAYSFPQNDCEFLLIRTGS